jgi:hypothetical protein
VAGQKTTAPLGALRARRGCEREELGDRGGGNQSEFRVAQGKVLTGESSVENPQSQPSKAGYQYPQTPRCREEATFGAEGAALGAQLARGQSQSECAPLPRRWTC